MTLRWGRHFSKCCLFCFWLMIAACLACNTRSRHNRPHQQTDEIWEITCYTCQNVSNNYVCNRLAVDRPCPKGTDYCHTLHILDGDGGSVMVNKKCAPRTECTHSDVGCFEDPVVPGVTKCVSCCDLQYCNEFIPANESTAILISTRIANSSSTNRVRSLLDEWPSLVLVLVLPSLAVIGAAVGTRSL